MSNFSIVHDATLQLRRMLFSALQATVDTDFGLGGSIERISLASPASELDDQAIASLYLYRFGIEPTLRNGKPVPDDNDPDLFHNPPLPLQLHYLFTPVSDEEDTNLLLLGRVLQQLNDQPVVDLVDGAPIDDSHGAASSVFHVYPEELQLEALNGLWAAFTSPLRLTTGIRLQTVSIDSALPPQRKVRARQLGAVAGQIGPR